MKTFVTSNNFNSKIPTFFLYCISHNHPSLLGKLSNYKFKNYQLSTVNYQLILITFENISCINFLNHIIKTTIVSICNNRLRLFLEFLQIINH